jgi:hypothetical protein
MPLETIMHIAFQNQGKDIAQVIEIDLHQVFLPIRVFPRRQRHYSIYVIF